MIDSQIMEDTQRWANRTERDGSEFSGTQVRLRLSRRDPRWTPELSLVLEGSYQNALEIIGNRSRRTLVDIFGGACPEDRKQEKVGWSYEIRAEGHVRRASKHLTAAEWLYVLGTLGKTRDELDKEIVTAQLCVELASASVPVPA